MLIKVNNITYEDGDTVMFINGLEGKTIETVIINYNVLKNYNLIDLTSRKIRTLLTEKKYFLSNSRGFIFKTIHRRYIKNKNYI